MRLCFDATRFGSGLDGAIELASSRGLPAVEYSFAPFATGKAPKALDASEKKSLRSVAELSQEKGVEFACLNLDYCVRPDDKKSVKQFLPMMTKLAQVAEVLGCPRLAFSLMPSDDDDWLPLVEECLTAVSEALAKHGAKPLLRLSTPQDFRGVSLKKWRAMEPQDWRDLVSACPSLSLSFSPADCVWLGIDYLRVLSGVAAAIDHVEAHDIEINRDLLVDSGMYGPLWWRYRMPGKGQVDWGQLIEALKLYDFSGTISVHLDDEFVSSEHEELEKALDTSLKKLAPFVRG
jgi:sugar phosphate isomerase/epimerase